MGKSLFKNTALISNLVKKISDEYPEKQIGKTVIQKMVYFIARKGVIDFEYTLYHYGPYSAQTSSELNFAKLIGALNINWIREKGFFIEPKNIPLEYDLKDKEKKGIEEVVKKYGKYNAQELSVITTALYIKDNFEFCNQNNLIDAVQSLKPQFKKDWIKSKLKEANVL
ncbi:DUF4065 domain-containing protein [bacterium]|nr:DUF4065 domain-containing protein [bacterium]